MFSVPCLGALNRGSGDERCCFCLHLCARGLAYTSIQIRACRTLPQVMGNCRVTPSRVAPGDLYIYVRSDAIKDGLTIELLILGSIDPLNPLA